MAISYYDLSYSQVTKIIILEGRIVIPYIPFTSFFMGFARCKLINQFFLNRICKPNPMNTKPLTFCIIFPIRSFFLNVFVMKDAK